MITGRERGARMSPQDASLAAPDAARLTRMDMHVHSSASDKPVIAALQGLNCPESFSDPERVYEQARARGMDLVTLTDHDTIEGGLSLVERGFEGFVLGEEVTVYFPEDRCKLHVLVWGLTPHQHDQIGALGLRDDVYAFARWLADEQLAHALAHPLYVQNERLTRWHLERACLLFKGFETLNGAHSGSHRDVLQKYLATLTPGRVQRLIDEHDLAPVWSRTWLKAVTGGSDDHALLNVGQTWTGVEGAPIADPQEFLRAVMAGKSVVGGQAGHASLLAHQLMSVGFNYYAVRWHASRSAGAQAVGATAARFAEAPAKAPRKAAVIRERLANRLPWRRRRSPLIFAALENHFRAALDSYPELADRLHSETIDPAMSDHESMARFTDDLSESLARAMADPALRALKKRDGAGIVDALTGYAAILGLQAPHIFSLFHQNKERRLLRELDQEARRLGGHDDESQRPMRVMLFTDTLGDVNGVCRFIQNMGAEAHEAGRSLDIVTATRFPTPDTAYIHNFDPVFATRMPKYENLELALPPVVRMLRLADRIQPDVIHISTPGPVGMTGLLASKMLKAPVLGVYHTDFPAYIDHLFEDSVYTKITTDYMRFFYRSFATIFTRSADYAASLAERGFPAEKTMRLTPGVALETFQPSFRDPAIWDRYDGVDPLSVKILYCGRVSVEKNLPLLTEVWPRVRRACAAKGRVAELIVVGDGPYRAKMQKELAGTGAHFLGFKHGRELSEIYASCDLFAFPSLTDTLGQVVLESQSSGLPVVVSDQGGPKEVVAEDVTGFVLPGDDPGAWTTAIARLVMDDEIRERMARSAHTRAQRYSIRASFDHFWRAHETAMKAEARQSARSPRPGATAAGTSASRSVA